MAHQIKSTKSMVQYYHYYRKTGVILSYRFSCYSLGGSRDIEEHVGGCPLIYYYYYLLDIGFKLTVPNIT